MVTGWHSRTLVASVILMMFRIFLPLAPQESWQKRGVAVAGNVCWPGQNWYFDWSLEPIQCGDAVGFPMIWGRQDLTGLQYHNGQIVFALNEPDRSDQSNIVPEAAAVLWHDLFEVRFPHVRPVGPAVSHDGEAWLLAWRAAYIERYGQPPRIWAMNAHCYADAEFCKAWVGKNIAWAREWTESGHVWLTEFAMLPCAFGGDDALARREADEFMAWLEETPEVSGYAWFGTFVDVLPPNGFGHGCDTSLIAANGHLTDWGRWYLQR